MGMSLTLPLALTLALPAFGQTGNARTAVGEGAGLAPMVAPAPGSPGGAAQLPALSVGISAGGALPGVAAVAPDSSLPGMAAAPAAPIAPPAPGLRVEAAEAVPVRGGLPPGQVAALEGAVPALVPQAVLPAAPAADGLSPAPARLSPEKVAGSQSSRALELPERREVEATVSGILEAPGSEGSARRMEAGFLRLLRLGRSRSVSDSDPVPGAKRRPQNGLKRPDPGEAQNAARPAAPAAPSVFDGLELREGWFALTLWRGGRKLRRLGAGQFGSVFSDPEQPGVVYKVIAPSADIAIFTALTLPQILREEAEVASALSEAGAGPRYLGTRKLGRYHVFAKETVRGETLEALIAARRFGERERELILGMLDRMADAGILVDDMRPPNIMIGTTESDPEPRAYLVDGSKELVTGERASELVRIGRFGPWERARVEELLQGLGEPPLREGDERLARIMIGATARDPVVRAYTVDEDRMLPVRAPRPEGREAFRQALGRQRVAVKVIGNMMAGMSEPIYKPFETILEEGLERSRETTWWQRFKTFLRESFANAQFPAK